MVASLLQPVWLLFALLACSLTVRAVHYSLTDNWVGAEFLQAFSWEAITDPTHGRVNYLSQWRSVALNLTYISSDRL
jgi:hypothetical protein